MHHQISLIYTCSKNINCLFTSLIYILTFLIYENPIHWIKFNFFCILFLQDINKQSDVCLIAKIENDKSFQIPMKKDFVSYYYITFPLLEYAYKFFKQQQDHTKGLMLLARDKNDHNSAKFFIVTTLKYFGYFYFDLTRCKTRFFYEVYFSQVQKNSK